MSSLVSWDQLHHKPGEDGPVRVCILGGDNIVNAVLRAYVELVGARSEAIAAAFRFFVVPVSGLLLVGGGVGGASGRRRSSSQSRLPSVTGVPPTSLAYGQLPGLKASLI